MKTILSTSTRLGLRLAGIIGVIQLLGINQIAIQFGGPFQLAVCMAEDGEPEDDYNGDEPAPEEGDPDEDLSNYNPPTEPYWEDYYEPYWEDYYDEPFWEQYYEQPYWEEYYDEPLWSPFWAHYVNSASPLTEEQFWNDYGSAYVLSYLHWLAGASP